jgi:hypothetical protein
MPGAIEKQRLAGLMKAHGESLQEGLKYASKGVDREIR